MRRNLLGVSGPVALSVACASGNVAIVETAPARADALECAAELLADRGYDVVRNDEARELRTEIRKVYRPVGMVRETITATLSEPGDTPAELQVTVRSLNYENPGRSSLPVIVSEIRPSQEIAADGTAVAQACAVEA